MRMSSGRTSSRLGIADVIVLYDLTNAHYHGGHDGELPNFGRSKQKRHDCPLITLALALAGAGFPRSAEILPGNASEPDTLRDAVVRLEAECGTGEFKPTVVIDAGIASEDNIVWLNEQGYDWIAVSRGAKPPPPEGAPGAVLITAAEHEVRAWRLAEEGGEARLYVVSEGKKATEDSGLEMKRTRFEAALDHLHQGLSVKGRLKRYEKVLESVGRLKQRFSKVANHYEISVEKAATGANAKALRYRRRKAYDDADQRAGAYVLRTSHTDWDIEQVLRTYWRITDIEATFRSLKSEPRAAADPPSAGPPHRGPPDDRGLRLPCGAADPHPPCGAGHRQVLDLDPREHADLGADHHPADADRRHADRQPPGHAPRRRGRRDGRCSGRAPALHRERIAIPR